MKVTVFVVLLLACVVYLWPFIRTQKACYDSSTHSLDNLGYIVASRGIGKEKVCESRSNILSQLEDCIKLATVSGTYAQYVYPVVQGAVSLSRPMSKGIQTLKEDHNLDCEDYSRYQFE